RNQGSVRPQSFGRQLKAGARARGRLIKQQRHATLGQDAVSEQRVFFFERGGAIQKPAYLLQAQVHDREQRSSIIGIWRDWHRRRIDLAADGSYGRTHCSYLSALAACPFAR